jgi:hypothetical protein
VTRIPPRHGKLTSSLRAVGESSARQPASEVTLASGQEPVRRPADPADEKEDLLVHLAFTSSSDTLEAAYAFLSAYAAERLRPAVATRINVALYELLSNALNYGSVRVDPVLQLVRRGERILVRVSNEAIPARIGMLREQLGKVVADAEGTYVAEMRRSVAGPTRAMLGLARLAHEARLDLEFDLTGSRVVVVAGCLR